MAWVETQHIAASMKLVDSLEEFDLLEQMLEESKPPAVPTHTPKHFLCSVHFATFPSTARVFVQGSKVDCGTAHPPCQGACSEIAYWRMRFILDSAGLSAVVHWSQSTRSIKPLCVAKPSI